MYWVVVGFFRAYVDASCLVEEDGGEAVPEQTKRVIVEGVNYGQLFQFPRLLRAATAALQPGRLVIGLLMITALITFGQGWDRVVGPAVSPNGLADGKWNPVTNGVAHQNALKNAMMRYTSGGGGASTATGDLETAAVLRAMASEYESKRAGLEAVQARDDLARDYAMAFEDIMKTRPHGVFEALRGHVAGSITRVAMGVLGLNAGMVIDEFRRLFIDTPHLLWKDYKWFTILFGVFAIIVLALGGGAISRLQATQMANQQRLGVRESLDYSLRSFGALVSAQALPLVVLGLLCGAIVLMGVLMAAPVLDVVGGLLYGFALLLGFLVAFLLIGYVVGHPLLIPAVACENCSGADAMQRAYAYVVTRPLHLLGYWAVALIGFGLGFLLVSVVAVVMLKATANLYGTLSSNPAMTVAGNYELFTVARQGHELPLAEWNHRWAAGLIGFWETVVLCLVGAYVISYHFSASTIMYLFMRRAADGQDVEEIWQGDAAAGAVTHAVSSDTPMTG